MKKMKHGEVIQSQQMKFTKLVAGHTFELVSAGKTPDGSKFKCEFCGVTGRYWVSIKREDGIKVKVGRTCLERAGLKLTEELKAKMSLPHKKKKPKTHVQPQNTKKAEKKEKVDLDEDLLKMLDDI